MTGEQEPLALEPGEGDSFALGPNRITVLVGPERTGDAYSVVLYELAAGFPGTPAHRHRGVETFHVLDGEPEFRLGERWLPARAGSLFFTPPWLPHTLRNPRPEPARLLVVAPPGGPRYLRELAEVIPQRGAPDRERLLEVFARFGTELAD